MPLMPGSSTRACSTTPMPFRTTRSEPSAPAPEHVTICTAGEKVQWWCVGGGSWCGGANICEQASNQPC